MGLTVFLHIAFSKVILEINRLTNQLPKKQLLTVSTWGEDAEQQSYHLPQTIISVQNSRGAQPGDGTKQHDFGTCAVDVW